MKITNRILAALLLIVSISWGSFVRAQDNDSIRYNQYGLKVDRIKLQPELRNGILTFESKDQNYKVWYDVRVQADGAVFFGDTYNEIGNGTSIRRARFAIKTEFGKYWYAELDMDISNSELEIKDAYLQFHNNRGLEMKVGNFKEGFSIESTTTSRYLTFIERSMAVNTFAPSRHIGFATSYGKNWLFAMGGVHFQDIGGLEERVFSEDNNKDFGTDEGYSLTGKLVLMPWHNNPDKGLHFGVAGSYRIPKTSIDVPGVTRYSTRSLTSINRKKYIDTDLMATDYTKITGLEMAGYYKGLRFQAEYIMSNVKRSNIEKIEKFNGFYVFGSWMLFGGKYNYNTGEAEFTQPTRGKNWGDLELAFRYDYLSLNSHMDGIMGGAGEGYTFGLNYHINNNIKIMLNYAYLNHDRYASGKNKLFVGYDMDGNLTKNPRAVADAKGKAGEKFNMVSIRFEVDF
jgi:phosphate-selective porin OprO and OprP